jgi:hypothetical protein
VVGNDAVSKGSLGVRFPEETRDRNAFSYLVLNPLLRLFTKSPKATLQCTLHALFLPTPFKYLQTTSDDPRPRKHTAEEVLKPGALYAECAVVPVQITPALSMSPAEDQKAKRGKETQAPDGDPPRPDDGELGGVTLGMQVWDDYEQELKAWEAAQPTTDGRFEGNNTESAARNADVN